MERGLPLRVGCPPAAYRRAVDLGRRLAFATADLIEELIEARVIARSHPVIHRRNINDITVKAEKELLSTYGLDHTRLIASGTEAKVYDLGAQEVLKVYADPDGTLRARPETLRDFYDRLDRSTVPYALPRIGTIEPHGPLLATLETRLPRQPMGEVCDLTAPESKALYLECESPQPLS
ncbi:hypothetical protein ACFV19_11470 [Streptomyces griseoluteus]|uniref:hypothetical protein n=1 Tax=Streptomyces griseoluteus TaxID=29306 RepID=UPI0036776209